MLWVDVSCEQFSFRGMLISCILSAARNKSNIKHHQYHIPRNYRLVYNFNLGDVQHCVHVISTVLCVFVVLVISHDNDRIKLPQIVRERPKTYENPTQSVEK